MTEATWLSSESPSEMLAYVADKISPRRLRLFACAVARHHIGMYDLRSVEAAERAVDLGQPDHNFNDRPSRLVCQWWAVCRAREAAELMARHHPGKAAAALLRCINGNPFRPTVIGRTERSLDNWWSDPDVLAVAALAYERRGRECQDCWEGVVYSKRANQPAAPCEKCGGTGTVEDGMLDPERLAVLSDALEEAGCPAEEKCSHCRGKGHVRESGIYANRYDRVECGYCEGKPFWPHPLLGHLRSPGPHCRGCWATDLILGKS